MMDNTASPLTLLAFLGFLILVGVLRVRDYFFRKDLAEQGQHANARITARKHDVDQSTDENNSTTTTETYYVSYQYSVGSATYSGREIVDANTYDILREGQPVEVVYMPTRPGQARLASSL